MTTTKTLYYVKLPNGRIDITRSKKKYNYVVVSTKKTAVKAADWYEDKHLAENRADYLTMKLSPDYPDGEQLFIVKEVSIKED